MLEITFGKRNIQAFNPKASGEITGYFPYRYRYTIAGTRTAAFSLLLTLLLLMRNVD